ncbi:MAG TPA: hypothetical protein VLN45_02240, partial [Ignavibacteriaceae bacterium]|nr:hypothetical protein [Ignavibacteriaceae bacterium]
MDRQTLLAFILIGAILIVWLYISSPTPPPPQKSTQKDTREVLKDTIKKIDEQKSFDLTETKTDSQNFGKYFEYVDKEERVITVENDVAVIELSTKGANLKKYFLKEFNNWYSAGADSSTYQTM